MSVPLLIAQTLLHRSLLGSVQLSESELDLRLGRRQLRPLQRLGRVFRKENLPNERAGEETIGTLEGFQDHVRTVSFGAVEVLFANGEDGFDPGVELGVRDDSYGSSLDRAHVALDVALVGLEADVL